MQRRGARHRGAAAHSVGGDLMSDNIEARVVRTLAQLVCAEDDAVRNSVDPRTAFSMDSLDELELLMYLEDEFDIELGDWTGIEWKSTADLVAVIRARLPS